MNNSLSEFDREYFLQTRREIDTEKRERDHILNFAIVVLGAMAFAVIHSVRAEALLKDPYSVPLETSALAIVTSLFWVRRKKLQQIADRWYALYRMAVRNLGEEWVRESMEAVAIKGFTKARYIRKDVVLNVTLCLPIYALLLKTTLGLPVRLAGAIILVVMIVGGHMIVSYALLGRKFVDPFPIETKGTVTTSNKTL
ncbi:MAG TPA: hypothetical protein VMZ31_04215 [Phycisphaerae bacterium]|nr:hypothetical protein [Phycisphaerae bacterium]